MQFAANFEHENFQELSTGDTYALATRLNALTDTVSSVCIIGKRGENVFFEKRNGTCSAGLARERVTVDSNKTSEISIEFTLGLPHELNVAIVTFAILQIFLIASLVFSTRLSERTRLNAKIQMANLAAQVAHDIRSPLAALTMAEKEFGALPEETRILVRSAVSRIRDIANHLLDKNREDGKAEQSTQHGPGIAVENVSTQLIPSLMDGLITEKRMQYRPKMGIEIEAHLESAYGLFAGIQPNEFKRVLSNLVNNSVEALGDKGKVTISLGAISDKQIQIEVRDNGKGIPSEILAKLGQRGQTHGKVGGSGLGLYHARTSVESWGGKLELQSKVGHGTAIVITLPQVRAPAWFVAELTLIPHSTLVVLDDDESIHRIWDGRADSAQLGDQGIKLVHLSTPTELRRWIADAAKQTTSSRYLFDYELLGFADSGLDLIEELGIAANSILVTSRFEDPAIRVRCERLQVPLIPKGMAGFVPIRVLATEKTVPAERLDAILIDDDEIVHLSWKFSAKKAGCKYEGFRSVDEFLDKADSLDRTVPIYIDSYLGKNKQGVEVQGEWVARDIFGMGFKQIYLATGLPPADVDKMSWLCGVREKEPPFSIT